MIKPTVGRVVLVFPSQHFHGALPEAGEPLPAQICRVLSDNRINVGGWDVSGNPFGLKDIKLLQDDEEAPENESYATWMEYQKEQAAKIEATEQPAGEVSEEEMKTDSGAGDETDTTGNTADTGNGSGLTDTV